MDRVAVTATELEQNIAIWLTTAGIDQPRLIRDLWTRKGEPIDRDRQAAARSALAAYLVAKMTASRYATTRPAPAIDRGV